MQRDARPPRSALAAAGLAVLVLACRSEPTGLRARLEADRAAPVVSTVREGSLVCLSPFDERTTRLHARSLAPLVAELAADLGAQLDEPVTLRFVPLEVADGDAQALIESAFSGRDGLGGYAGYREGEAVVFVPRAHGDLGIGLALVQETVRHELVHLLAARAGLDNGQRWFAEGLARTVAALPGDDAGPRLDGPRSLETWKHVTTVRAGDVDELLRWGAPDLGRDALPAGEARRYALAQDLVTYLLAGRPEASLAARAHAVAALTRADLRAAEAGWLAEARRYPGPVEEALALLESGDAWQRSRALGQLQALAGDPEHADAVLAAGVEARALAALDDPATFGEAAEFLLFACRDTLATDGIDALVTAPTAPRRLLGHALRQQRGSTPGADERASIRAAAGELDGTWQGPTTLVRLMLSVALAP